MKWFSKCFKTNDTPPFAFLDSCFDVGLVKKPYVVRWVQDAGLTL